MSNAVTLVELVASASSDLDERPPNCFGCADERTIYTRIWQGVAIASLAVNITAMVIEESVVMIVAGIVACCIAPVVIFLQFKLQDTDTLRMVQNALRKEVNRLNEENDKLAEEVKILEGQVGRLHQEESKLESITKQQGIDSQTFMHLIEENSTTIGELKIAVKDDVVQTLVTACIDSDFDQSGTFSDQEIQILELRMQSIPGVIVNHALLKETVQKSDRQLESILALVKHITQSDLPKEQRIFQFDETKISTPSTSPLPNTSSPSTQQ